MKKLGFTFFFMKNRGVTKMIKKLLDGNKFNWKLCSMKLPQNAYFPCCVRWEVHVSLTLYRSGGGHKFCRGKWCQKKYWRGTFENSWLPIPKKTMLLWNITQIRELIPSKVMLCEQLLVLENDFETIENYFKLHINVGFITPIFQENVTHWYGKPVTSILGSTLEEKLTNLVENV